jgi:NAD(P)-dependent dehydrogenase (short-subunit alcohol dehydrogenase family)
MSVALVTGGTRGIGLGIAERLVKDGCAVGLIYQNNQDAAEAARATLGKDGGKVAIAKVDVRHAADVAAAVKALESELGARFTTVVNNAGAVDDALFLFASDERIRHTMDVHLFGAMNATRAVLKGMIAKRAGNIINVISPSAFRGRAGQSAYSAAKGALLSWTKTLAQELGASGIRVNALCPGLIDTDIVKALPENVKSGLLDRVSMGRLGLPEEVAACAAFLLRATYMHGAVLSVDGGLR